MQGKRLNALLILWACATAMGMGFMMRWQASPNECVVAAERIPPIESIVREEGKSTMVMFLHPMCPCSQASLSELERLMARTPDFTINIVALSYGRWNDTPLLRRAKQINDLHIVPDPSGAIAKQFDARISGEVFFYDPNGKTTFHGGITSSRGHEGDNPGSAAIFALLHQQNRIQPPSGGPVYGCPLFASAQENEK